MEAFLRRSSLAFAAGAVGAVVNSFVVWLVGQAGITAIAGVRLAPSFHPSWMYTRIVWGALWGFLLLLPYARSRPITRGVVLSLVPSAVQLLFLFPTQTPHGLFGLGLGALTPVFILAFNAVWGIVAAFWFRELG